MSNSSTSPCLKDGGVTFTVTVEYKTHECLVSEEALSGLSQLSDTKLDSLSTYRAFEAKINGVARRLITAGITGSPILLGTRNFG